MSKNSKASLYDLADQLQEVYNKLKSITTSNLEEKQDVGEVKKINQKLDKLKTSLNNKLKTYLEKGNIEHIYHAQAQSHDNEKSDVAALINSLTESHISHQIVHFHDEDGVEVMRRGDLFVLPICVSTKSLNKPFDASLVLEEIGQEFIKAQYMQKNQQISIFPELISNFELEFLDYKVWHDLHVELLGGPMAIDFHERIIPCEEDDEENEAIEEGVELFFIVGTVFQDIVDEEKYVAKPLLFKADDKEKIELFVKGMSEHEFEYDIAFMAPFDFSVGLYIGCGNYYQQIVEEFVRSFYQEDAQTTFFFAMTEEMNNEQYFVIGALEEDSTLKEYMLVKRQPYLDEDLFIGAVEEEFSNIKVFQTLFVEEFVSLNAIERSQDLIQYFYNFSGVKSLEYGMQMLSENKHKYLH